MKSASQEGRAAHQGNQRKTARIEREDSGGAKVFTDRRAYVNAMTYSIETETSILENQASRRIFDDYRRKSQRRIPRRQQKPYSFTQLEEAYNELKNERTTLSAELADLIKPVNVQKNLWDAYVSDHMVTLTPAQMAGLQDKTEAWGAENSPDQMCRMPKSWTRCESCHVGIREPVKLTATGDVFEGQETGRIRAGLHEPSDPTF